MKINTPQATIAILDLVLEMAAKNMAFHEAFVSLMCEDETMAERVLADMKSRSDYNLTLLRGKVLQYAEIDQNDLLNGLFDI